MGRSSARALRAVKQWDRAPGVWPDQGWPRQRSRRRKEKEADGQPFTGRRSGVCVAPQRRVAAVLAVSKATRTEADVQAKRVRGQLARAGPAAPGRLCLGALALSGDIEKLGNGRMSGAEMGWEGPGRPVL